ncbi:MAG: hypothetical protein R3B83_06030 [Nitrospirales bacterium]|nr:hypothetical protein [Nitrospirales bacterium]
MIRTILLVVVVFIGVSLGYCYVGLNQYTWHQKMTMEVELMASSTPGQVSSE